MRVLQAEKGTTKMMSRTKPTARASACIRPVPLALGVVSEEPFYGRQQAEAMVGDDGVVGDEPVGELPVEEVKVGKEQVPVPVDELLLNGAVEPLGVGVHLGALGVSSVVGEAKARERLVEGALELGTVISCVSFFL
jgi:hypothetical protein